MTKEEEAKKKIEDDKKSAEKLTAELEQLKKENTELKAAAENDPDPDPEPTPAPNEPTEAQWGELERKYGMERDEIKRQWPLIQAAIEPVRQENAQLKASQNAERNVATARKVFIGKDKQAKKLLPYVDEYLADVAPDVKADPKRLAKEMERAVRFARGSVPPSELAGGRRTIPEGDTVVVDDDLTNDDEKDGAFYDTHVDRDHKIRMKVERKVDKEYRNRHAHPEHEGGVLIREQDEWEAAKKK